MLEGMLAGMDLQWTEADEQGDAESQRIEPAIEPGRADQTLCRAGRAMFLRHGTDLLKGSARIFSDAMGRTGLPEVAPRVSSGESG